MAGADRADRPRRRPRPLRPHSRSLAWSPGPAVTLRYLLDTTIVSEPLRARPDRRVLARLIEHAELCATAAPVVHELRYGSAILGASKRRDAIDAYIDDVVLASYPVLPYDLAAAEWHARERARFERRGRPRPFADGLIAAVAAARG